MSEPSIHSPAAAAASAAPRTRPLADFPALAQRAVDLLLIQRALVRLDEADARGIVQYLREVAYPPGATVLRAGEQANFMLLLLEGEVAVHPQGDDASGDPVAVLGPGSVLGEMSLFDGSPRSATCIALSTVRAAGLARKGLERLVVEQPAVAARLMAGLAQQMAERLRAAGDQVMIYAQLNDELRERVQRLSQETGAF